MTGKKQIEVLMNELLGFAKKMLIEYGEFHPFGGYLKPSGAVVHVGVESESEGERSQDKVDSLINGLKNLAAEGKSIGSGIVSDVKLPRDDGSKGDAIKFLLEHQDGYCAEVFFRYELVAGGVEVTDVTAQQGDPLFFVSAH